MTRRRRTPLCLCLGALLVAPVGCSNGSSHGDDEAANPSVADVVYVGSPTDEALLRLIDGLPGKDVASRKLVFDAPSANAPLSRDAPVSFAYHGASALERYSNETRSSKPKREVSRRNRWRWDLQALFGAERSAWAHGTPFNGTGYYLVFSDAGATARLRVFTDQTSYLPDDAAWSRIASAAQPITLKVWSADFEENAIPANGGPFVAGEFTFEIR
jgi:hypothetical protein